MATSRSLASAAIDRTAMVLGLRFRGSRRSDELTPVSRFESLQELVAAHFDSIGAPHHPSRPTIESALRSLDGRPATIVETGTAAWGTKSTLLFSDYARHFGGDVTSIDKRVGPAYRCRSQASPQVRFLIGDSGRILRLDSLKQTLSVADLIYLDSWDVDLGHPYAAAAHGMSEFLAIADVLKSGAQVLVDDTPVSMSYWGAPSAEMRAFHEAWGAIPGKGAFILKLIDKLSSFEVVAHEYQLLMRKL